MTDFLMILLLLSSVGGAGAYVWKHKKSGQRCIGCPHGGQCKGHCGGCND